MRKISFQDACLDFSMQWLHDMELTKKNRKGNNRMNLPSIKTLSLVFDDAEQARKILGMTHGELASTDVGRARIAECYHPPKWYDVRLTVLNSIDPGLYGVDGIESNTGEWATYLNTGDTYTPTIIYWRGRYRVQSVGDFIEAMEKRSIHFA